MAPAPIPLIDPHNANIWHCKWPGYLLSMELFMSIGNTNTIEKSQNAKFSTNKLDGVRNDFDLKRHEIVQNYGNFSKAKKYLNII